MKYRPLVTASVESGYTDFVNVLNTNVLISPNNVFTRRKIGKVARKILEYLGNLGDLKDFFP